MNVLGVSCQCQYWNYLQNVLFPEIGNLAIQYPLKIHHFLLLFLTFNPNQNLSLTLPNFLLFPKPQTGVWMQSRGSGVKVLYFLCPPSSPPATSFAVHECSVFVPERLRTSKHNPGSDYIGATFTNPFHNIQTLLQGDRVGMDNQFVLRLWVHRQYLIVRSVHWLIKSFHGTWWQ